MKRLFDFFFSLFGIIFLLPVLILISLLIYVEDFSSPFYIANRVGLKGKIFKIIKFRTMVVNADKSGVDSTSANDSRITNIGKIIRKFKLDEFTQLINVLIGNMSLVGPRPNVQRETFLYTDIEKKILEVKPGITDISSIVFSDEGEILSNHDDPDIGYNQLIRPWKSRLALFYIENKNFIFDFEIIILTFVALMNKKLSLRKLARKMRKYNVSDELINFVRREEDLKPTPPPGADKIVNSR